MINPKINFYASTMTRIHVEMKLLKKHTHTKIKIRNSLVWETLHFPCIHKYHLRGGISSHQNDHNKFKYICIDKFVNLALAVGFI